MKILLFRLEGVMQSWGELAKWDYRSTELFPSKSGIVGMIAAAMGLQRGDVRIQELCKSITIGTRADRAGEVRTDYQTVSSSTMLTAKGKKRSGGNTIITPKSYLFDASFLVAVTADSHTLRDCLEALNNPVWPVYLGRKCCTPNIPVLGKITTEYDSIIDALNSEPLIERHDEEVFIQVDGTETQRFDVIIDSSKRHFTRRGVNTLLHETKGM